MTYSPKRSTPLLPAALVVGFILQCLTLVIVAGQGFALRRLGQKPAPTLVQLSDGNALRVKATPALERTPVTIKAFVANSLTSLFNLKGQLTNAAGQTIRDPGIEVPGSEGDSTTKKVTTASATASFALASDFRMAFLQRLAESTPDGVFTGRQQVVLVIDQVGEPTELAPGKWQVEVLANLNVFNSTNALQEVIAFNRQVVVEATSAPVVPEGDTPLEQAIYKIRQAGLQITDIRPIDR